jgi:hypothetical protein
MNYGYHKPQVAPCLFHLPRYDVIRIIGMLLYVVIDAFCHDISKAAQDDSIDDPSIVFDQ